MAQHLSGRYTITSRTWRSAVIVCGHGVDDLYQGAVPALLPTLVTAYGWSYTMAGGITLAATVLSSVTQPVFGLWTDRRPAPWLVPVGMLVAGAGVAAAGPWHSYALICCLFGLSGLGVAAYHPESARLARRNARGSHTAMSWYSLSGNLGFAIAPLIVGPLVAVGGLGATPWLILPVAAMAATTLLLVPATRGRQPATETKESKHSARQDNWRAFTTLTVVITMRSVATYGIATLLALLVRARTHTSAAETAALVVFYAVGATGTLAGGWLTQRGWHRTNLLVLSYLTAIPAILATAFAPGWTILPAAGVSGLALFIPFSLHVTLGQDYLPHRIGTASGVTLGLAISAGGLAAPFLGNLADRTSLATAVAALAAFIVVALIFATTLPEPAPVDTNANTPTTGEQHAT